jgi:hypothetical protein
VLHQHHDEVLKPVVTSFPWASLLYDRAGVLPERADFVAALRRVGVILVFLRGIMLMIPHKSRSNVRYANGVSVRNNHAIPIRGPPAPREIPPGLGPPRPQRPPAVRPSCSE